MCFNSNYYNSFISRAVALVFAAILALVLLQSAEAQTPRIVVLGDSLVAGYQLPPGEGFPAQLQKSLDRRNIDVQIISAGVSGDTTTGGLARIDWSVPDGIDGVILELGANDAMRGVPVERARQNLDDMLKIFDRRRIAVLLVGMRAPPNMGEDYQQAFDAIYPALARKYEVVFYPFFLDGVAADPSLNLADGIHPNEAGIAIMIEKFMPYAERFIAGISKAK